MPGFSVPFNLVFLCEYLNKRLKKGQRVALEIFPSLLSAIRAGNPEAALSRVPKGETISQGKLLFMSELVKYLDHRGIEIVPLYTPAEFKITDSVLREQRYARKIVKLAASGKKPDMVIVGAVHVETLASLLEKRGFMVKRTYRANLPKRKLVSLIRKYAAAEEKERLALLKRKLKKKQQQIRSGKLKRKRRPLPK